MTPDKRPAKTDKQAKAARLQAALRDNLRRRKAAAAAAPSGSEPHENGTSQETQN